MASPEREYTYQVDLDGTLWHDGWPTDLPALYQAFYRTLQRQGDGRLRARCQGETCWIEPADTPFVVDSVDVLEGEPDAEGEPTAREMTLILTGGLREPIEATSLSVGDKNVLYVRVRDGDFPARFTRKAYYQLARYTAPTHDGFVLRLGGASYPIAGS